MNNTLTIAEIELLNSLLIYNIEEVHYVFWENTAKKNDFFECVDYIEFLLENESRVFVFCNENSDYISITDAFDFDAKQSELQQKFNNKVSLRKVDVSTSDTWVGLIHAPIQKIDFAKDDYGKIINSGFALQYNDCMVLIGLGEEGLYVELIEKEEEDELI